MSSSRGEYRVIMIGVIAVCAVGCASAVWPQVAAVASAVAVVLLIAAGVSLVGGVVWLVCSEIAFARELERLVNAPVEPVAERVEVRS
jgi:hypothetical protein